MRFLNPASLYFLVPVFMMNLPVLADTPMGDVPLGRIYLEIHSSAVNSSFLSRTSPQDSNSINLIQSAIENGELTDEMIAFLDSEVPLIDKLALVSGIVSYDGLLSFSSKVRAYQEYRKHLIKKHTSEEGIDHRIPLVSASSEADMAFLESSSARSRIVSEIFRGRYQSSLDTVISNTLSSQEMVILGFFMAGLSKNTWKAVSFMYEGAKALKDSRAARLALALVAGNLMILPQDREIAVNLIREHGEQLGIRTEEPEVAIDDGDEVGKEDNLVLVDIESRWAYVHALLLPVYDWQGNSDVSEGIVEAVAHRLIIYEDSFDRVSTSIESGVNDCLSALLNPPSLRSALVLTEF